MPMLCDRIMEPTQFTLIAILSVLLAGVPTASSWRSNEFDRHDGYDLQRGPVLYEAYYPDDQGLAAKDQQRSPINPQTAWRYVHRASLLEKTYQALKDSQNSVPHERRSRHGREQLFPGNYNMASVPTNIFRSTAQEPRIPMDLRADSDQAYEVAQQLKRFVEGPEQDSNPRKDLITGDFEDHRSSYEEGAITGTNFHASNPYPETDYETAFLTQNLNSDRRRDDYVNIILSAVKKKALEISKGRLRDVPLMPDSTEESVRVSRKERIIESKNSFDRPWREMRDVQGNLNTIARSLKTSSGPPVMESEDWDRYSDKQTYSNRNDELDGHNTFEDEYNGERRPISQISLPHMENIFQPRSQIISYKFSPMRTPTKKLSSTGGPKSELLETRSAVLNNQPLGNYGDNLIENEMRKVATRSDGLINIASIEVSEIPHHKIRHHHGEKPKYNHRRHTKAKADQ